MRDKIIIIKDQIKSAQLLFRQLPRARLALGGAFVLLIGFLLYQSLVLIQEHKFKAINLQIASQKKLLNSYTQILKHADVLERELNDEEKKFEIIKVKFLDNDELSDYFAQFRESAQASRLKVLTLDFTPQEAITTPSAEVLASYKKIRLVISLKGNYYDAMSFVYGLEYNSPKIFDIDSVQIRRDSVDSNEIFMDMKTTIYILVKQK